MKINIIPTNKLAMLSAAVCAVMLPFSHNASADASLTFTDTHVVGTVSPAAPASASDVADYINFMITLAAPTGPTLHDFGGAEGIQTISRSSNLFASLPMASAVGSVSDSSGNNVVNLGVGTFTYLFAKYDGQNDNSVVWNIAGLSGTLTIPLFGPGGYGLSGWILFGPGAPGVPDGGTTVMLLGAALGALGMARRFLKI